ncbi:MAG: hypothetical protein ACRDOI_22020 [Trebonia sp.]
MIGEASLWKPGLRIYHMTGVATELREEGAPAWSGLSSSSGRRAGRSRSAMMDGTAVPPGASDSDAAYRRRQCGTH